MRETIEALPPAPPSPWGQASTRNRWRSLPPDILRQACKRVTIMILSIAAIWAIDLLMTYAVAPLLRHMDMKAMEAHETFPLNFIAPVGLAASLAAYLLARRLRENPHHLINLGLVLQIVTAALVATFVNWEPVFEVPRISWLCLIIVIQPAVVPSPPLKTLVVSLIIATMDPVAVWLAHLRGVPLGADAYALLWYFLPNYISVGLAMIPASIISGLGRQVSQARELGSYRLGDLLGRGGMGEVYRARHQMLARPAAIKLIRPEALGAGNAGAANVIIQRFRREAQAAALLRSPHTISLYDFGVTDDGTFYYVMELLEGLDLESLVKRFGPVPAGRAIFLLRHACHSLGEAHARGLVHRDIKPSNIFTCRLGLNVDFVKVLDFGLVKLDRQSAHAQAVLLTQPDVTTGTPAFMAPEMALGESPIDRRADIYALGCVGYWLLTGRLVFETDTPVKMLLQHVRAEPTPPSRYAELEVPPELDRIVLQCLAKKPADRPSTTGELATMLARVRVADCWTKDRAEQWWETHLPAAAPFTELRERTPVATVHAAK